VTLQRVRESRAAAAARSRASPAWTSPYPATSVSAPDTTGGTLHLTVHARHNQRIGGHRALLLIEYLSDSKIAGPPVATWALWTLEGTDI
jgi:succinylarginine dihydrolase